MLSWVLRSETPEAAVASSGCNPPARWGRVGLKCGFITITRGGGRDFVVDMSGMGVAPRLHMQT